MMTNIAVSGVSSVSSCVRGVTAEMPPGYPSLCQVILLERIKLCETPSDLIVEYGAFEAPLQSYLTAL